MFAVAVYTSPACRVFLTAPWNCLSRRGRGRADPARPRLRLDEGGELGPSGLGLDADARRPPRDRARQPRPWRNRPSSTIRPTITPSGMADDVRALLDHLEHRARRRDGLFDGRADHGVPGAAPSASGCAPPSSAGSACIWSTAWACRRASRRRWRRRRSPTSPIRRAARSAPSPTRPQSDRRALAACIRGSRQVMSREEAAAIKRAGADRGRQQGRDRGLARRSLRRSFPARRR